MTTGPLWCREVVEHVSDYLDGALPPRTRAAVAQHLRDCAGCATYVEQIRITVRALASTPDPDLDSAMCALLVAAFRDWKTRHHTEA